MRLQENNQETYSEDWIGLLAECVGVKRFFEDEGAYVNSGNLAIALNGTQYDPSVNKLTIEEEEGIWKLMDRMSRGNVYDCNLLQVGILEVLDEDTLVKAKLKLGSSAIPLFENLEKY